MRYEAALKMNMAEAGYVRIEGNMADAEAKQLQDRGVTGA